MTDHLHARAMRTKAAEHCNDMATSHESTPKQGMAYRSAARHILALPLEADHAAILAEAVKLPEIAALIEFVEHVADGDPKDYTNNFARAAAALAALETP